MSTALVSPSFIDMNDVLLQNQRNFANNRSQLSQNFDQKVVGSPIRSAITKPRVVNPMANMKLPSQQPNTVPNHQHTLISIQEAVQQQIQQGFPKLNRSVSEPTDKVSAVPQVPSQKVHIDSSRYKTELCRPFEENGFCKYGDKCQFAHGMNELRSLHRHPKYKTELCRTFHTTGFCRYGPRCHFVHNEDAGRLNQINQMKQVQVVQQLSSQALPMSQSQPQQQQQQVVSGGPVRTVSQPMAMNRPKAFNFSLSMPPMMRESLGSCADSPPSSVTSDSPTMSPTLLREQDMYTGFPGAFSPPPASAPAQAVSSAFNFQDFPITAAQQQHQQSTTMGPLNVNTDPIASLAAGLQAASLNQRNNNFVNADLLRDLTDLLAGYSTHSPDSISGSNSGSESSVSTCGSPLEVSRGLRLPIFSQLVNDE